MKHSGFKNLLKVLGVSLLSPGTILAQGTACPGGHVIVLGAGERAQAICEAASEAIEQLASCSLTVPMPITVEITQSIPDNCLGLYHCDNELVQLLPVDAYVTYLSGRPESLWGHLEPEVFFRSVLRHELTHASLDAMPCPFEACPATKEFVAYNMQIWFLPNNDRAPFDERAAKMEHSAFRDGESAIALMMVPELFITNAYAFLGLHDDQCRLVSEIANGEIIFDLPPR